MAILGRPITLGGMSSGGKMLFGVTLPKSIYYEQAAEWLKIKDNPRTAVGETNWDGQVVCGGHLWELYGNKAYCYSLEDGELLETVPLTGISGYSNAITTDGVSRIWFVRRRILSPSLQRLEGSDNGQWEYQQYVQAYLYEFDTTSKSTKSLCMGESKNNFTFDNTSSSNLPVINKYPDTFIYQGVGLIGYSKSSNKVYFGAVPYTNLSIGQVRYYSGSTSKYLTISSKQFHRFIWEYDLFNTTCKELVSIPAPSPFSGRYFYDDGDFFYLGNGYTSSEREHCIYRYNKQSNIWEIVTNEFLGYTDGPFSYVQIGDKMLQISRTATGVFDPKTGNLENLSVPVIPPDNMVIYPGFKAFSNNILYLVTNQGVYKCPFFSEVPEDAPIVCKIYKGQKYHTLEPFSIPNKVNFLRTQQTATEDIEIKMYEYDSAGGQTIYIEDTGRG